MCREEPETGPSLEASEHQQDCSGVRKIIWRANKEKTVRRNIMVINEYWRIFRKILKLDLALDKKSGRRRLLGHACSSYMCTGSALNVMDYGLPRARDSATH